MKLQRNLYIIEDIEGLDYVIKYLDLNLVQTNDLISFIPIKGYKQKLNKFSNIYDLSKYENKQVVEFYFNNVLNLDFKKEDNIEGEETFKDYETQSHYENIYIYDKKIIKCDTNLKMIQDFFILQNRFYGMDTILKEYCNYNGKIYPFIEHSPLWDGGFSHYELETISPAIFSYSDYRRNYILKSGLTTKDVVRMGPSIHYAESLYCNKFIMHIKKILGKTLLAFPGHSHLYSKIQYDEKQFAQYIEKFAIENNFESVLICMFHQDIMFERDKIFKDKGFIIVSSGHKYDVNFLGKLKCLIEICDYSMSNMFSTHVGYCIFMNKPHHIFMQDVIYHLHRPDEEEYKVKVKKYKLGEIFQSLDNNISKKQYELCNEYWGFEHIKTREEMKFILEFYEDVYLKCKDKITDNMDMKEIESVFNSLISSKLSSEKNIYNKLILESRQ